jgi:hypothetical protein
MVVATVHGLEQSSAASLNVDWMEVRRPGEFLHGKIEGPPIRGGRGRGPTGMTGNASRHARTAVAAPSLSTACDSGRTGRAAGAIRGFPCS